MTDEQRKEIVKSHFYGYSVKQIAEIEEVSEKEVSDAVAWGEQNGYRAELEERRKDVYSE